MYGWILCALKSIHATSPSLAGQTVVKTGSSPDFASSLVRSSQFLSDFHRIRSALQWRDLGRLAGPCRYLTGLPY